MAEEKVKEYTNGEITIVWKPEKCIHSGVCVKTLPDVYHPKEKPWIQIDNASTPELQDQVKKCPSGALTYYMNGDKKRDEESSSMETKVEVLENGPLMVYGTLTVQNKDGSTEKKNKTTAFCRCGQSQNKPYCDGAHVKAEFKG